MSRLRMAILVFLVGLWAIPASSFGENPWDPDSPTGGSGTTVQSSSAQPGSGGAEDGPRGTEFETSAASASSSGSTGGSNSELQQQQQPRGWLDLVKRYWFWVSWFLR